MKLIESNWGIASRSGDTIILNRRLAKYPKLRKALIIHEANHSPNYNFNDLMMDVSVGELKGMKKVYYKFILTNPSSWTEYLPLWIEKGEIKFSPTMLAFWGTAALFVGILLKIII